MPRPLRVATRGSRLARWQADRVVELLGADAELVVVSTEGDRRQDVELHAMGGRGVFSSEVQQVLRAGDADVAVHSAKDLPSRDAPGLTIAAVPERGDPRDALVGSSLDAIPTGGRIGTGSVRRRAQLAAARPDLAFGPLRGNIETRVGKAGEYDAIVVAAAALDRLGFADRADELLDPTVMLPQVGQGALAVECRADDAATVERIAAIEHAPSRAALDAERAYLAELGGGCDLPAAAFATLDETGTVQLDALLASLDGRIVLRARTSGEDPVATGREAADQILVGAGGRELLLGEGVGS